MKKWSLVVISLLEIVISGNINRHFPVYDFESHPIESEIDDREAGVDDNDEISGSSKIYPGQSEDGDGNINSKMLNEYVNARYPHYKLDESYEIDQSLYQPMRQFKLSFFVKNYCNSDGSVIYSKESESNCAPTALYVVLKNWEANKIIHTTCSMSDATRLAVGKPFYTEKCGIDKIEKDIYSPNDKKTYYYWSLNEEDLICNVPYFYENIWNYAYDLGYEPDSGFPYKDVKLLATNVLLNVGNLSFNVSQDGTSRKNALTNLKKGVASYMSIKNSSSYANHAVALVGYSKYKYTIGSSIYVKYFYLICDGHNDDSVYFDPNTAYSPTLRFITN